MIADLYEKATGSALAFHTTRSWLTGWTEEKKVSISPQTKLKYEQIVREFLDHLKEKADAPIDGIVDGDLIGFRNSLARAGHSGSTHHARPDELPPRETSSPRNASNIKSLTTAAE